MNKISRSDEETKLFGKELGKKLQPNSIVCFYGDLGAGKTTLIKGIVEGIADVDQHQVTSPTFSLLNIYEGKKVVYHFDLYRLKDEKDFLAMGFDEYFEREGVCLVEWSERIQTLFPNRCTSVTLEHHPQGRMISIN